MKTRWARPGHGLLTVVHTHHSTIPSSDPNVTIRTARSSIGHFVLEISLHRAWLLRSSKPLKQHIGATHRRPLLPPPPPVHYPSGIPQRHAEYHTHLTGDIGDIDTRTRYTSRTIADFFLSARIKWLEMDFKGKDNSTLRVTDCLTFKMKRSATGEVDDRPLKRVSIRENLCLEPMLNSCHVAMCDPDQSLRLLKSPLAEEDLQDKSTRLVTASRSYFLDLPVELVLIVFANLDDLDLFAVSMVCRTYQSWVLPMYFKRLGVTLPCDEESAVSILKPEAFRTLCLWRRSAFYSPPHALFCWFSSNARQAAIDSANLRRFLLSLKSTQVPQVIHLYIRTDMECQLLGAPPTLLSLRGVNLRPPLPSSLTVFHVEAPILMSQQLLFWAILTINSSPLVELHFLDLQLTASEWARLLPRLTAPQLESLRIDGSMTLNSLYNFLSRHGQIRVLHIGACLGRLLKPTSPSPPLPLLDFLSGPTSYLEHLLSNPHPNLTRLEISDYRSSTSGVLSRAAACRGLFSVCIAFPLDSADLDRLKCSGTLSLLSPLAALQCSHPRRETL
ncbi:hypothetical protein A0H81_12044 [Grifola frondosa]|uniref:F-box domain-containing protein n=1 Tax=Grifola frondosa TaxID=5627 RepID=A0A1C7LTZ9_GRIFR|nr:hypothetical protein A0H81_12044 [Grifola frondosa]